MDVRNRVTVMVRSWKYQWYGISGLSVDHNEQAWLALASTAYITDKEVGT
jgi:hypothetical protein